MDRAEESLPSLLMNVCLILALVDSIYDLQILARAVFNSTSCLLKNRIPLVFPWRPDAFRI